MIPLDDSRVRTAEVIFREIVQTPPERRRAALIERCGSDLELREFVEQLVACDAQSDGRDDPRLCLTKSHVSRLPSAGPTRVGHYAIVREIGHGGAGVIYEAQQSRPHRRIALKLLRFAEPGSEALRRFQLEAEALGKLNHAGIAHIYEAGIDDAVAPTGERVRVPFVAMELIQGPPLCEYADTRQLSVRSRIALLARVCDAVHHAHQKGVIHRDLKPSNILIVEAPDPPQRAQTADQGAVTRADPAASLAVPKIIDFGVARLDAASLNSVAQTRAGQLLGTVAYMCPEQLAGDADAVDTRSDVYSLGVVGYELLAGRPPIDVAHLPLPQAIRAMAEQDPPRAGTVRRELRGDLETILAKAMEKLPDRRYVSAAEFAADLRRFLRHEPISAQPRRRLYRVALFARRNRALVTVAGFALLALIGGVIGTATFAWRESRQRLQATDAAQRAEGAVRFLSNMLASVDPRSPHGASFTVREVLDAAAERLTKGELTDQPEARGQIHRTLGETYYNLAFYPEARAQLSMALSLLSTAKPRQDAALVDTTRLLAGAASGLAEYSTAERLYSEALQAAWRLRKPKPHAASVLNDLGVCLAAQSKFDEAESAYRQALELRTTTPDIDPLDLAQSLSNLGTLLHMRSRLQDAEPLLREALRIRRALLPPNHPQLADSARNLGSLLQRCQELDEAGALLEEALAISRKALPPGHPDLAISLNAYAFLLKARGRLDEAVSLLREAVQIQLDRNPPDHPDVGIARVNLAHALSELGRPAESLREAEQGLEVLRRAFGPDNPMVASALHNLAVTMSQNGEFANTEPMLREALRIVEQQFGPAHDATAHMRDSLGVMLLALDRPADALDQLEPALARRRELLGESHTKVGLSWCNVAQARLRAGDPVGASEAADRAADILQSDAGSSAQLAVAMLTGVEARLNSDVSEAETSSAARAIVAEARSRLCAAYSEHSWQVADADRVEARRLVQCGQVEEASALLAEALAKLDTSATKQAPHSARVLRQTLAALAELPAQ
ncbi:MAG: serine/threonine-protein kinase [Phycisphaerae bacterium]